MTKDAINHSFGCPRDPAFFERVFDVVAERNRRSSRGISRLFCEHFVEASKEHDRLALQESVAVRNLFQARELALRLVDDSGNVDMNVVTQATEAVRKQAHVLGPGRHLESQRRLHFLLCLRNLSDLAVRMAVEKVMRPHNAPNVDQILRDTLGLDRREAVTDRVARCAALAAWLTMLRQNVGSCFATAPAIMIQQEQPLAFFRDIDELLSTQQLQRRVRGVDYSVPMNMSWGVGELRRPSRLSMESPVWKDPGMIEALKAVDLIPTEKLFSGVLQEGSMISPEQILSAVLMRKHGITQNDLIAYESRAVGRLDPSFTGGTKSKSRTNVEASCEKYQEELNVAQRAFNLLTENPLLKCWEFTLASFSETKHNFSRWNLHASLGMATDDVGGIGHKLYLLLKEKVDFFNEEVRRHQDAYEPLYDQVKMLETRIRTASTEQELKYRNMELRSRISEMNSVLELRDQASYKAKLFSQLYDFLLEEYDAYFRDYFQEVYDPDVHEVTVGPYDDSPAGFRLLYKHGRSQASLWSLIHSPREFVDALSSFFIATEPEIVSAEGLERVKDEVRSVTTQLVAHVKTEEFLLTAFHRMARVHNAPLPKNPLENMDKVEKKPWVHTSGGTMNALLSCYYSREGDPKLDERWVEEPDELLVFLLDTVRKLPDELIQVFAEEPNRSLMMHSPTHAFSLKPGITRFKEGWQSELYTYTWVRDQVVAPAKQVISEIRLDRDAQELLLTLIAEQLPPRDRPLFAGIAKVHGSMSPREFRQELLERAGKTLWYLAELVDQTLYTHLPIIPGERVAARVREVFDAMEEKGEEYSSLFAELDTGIAHSPMTSSHFSAMCKGLMLLVSGKASDERDRESKLLNVLREKRLKLSAPVVVADTNWTKHHFAFLVNPGTERLEFWRVEEKGEFGAPMTTWRQWLDGSHRKPTWGVYAAPAEYGFFGA